MFTRRDALVLGALGIVAPSQRLAAQSTPQPESATPVATPGATPVADVDAPNDWPTFRGNDARTGGMNGPVPSVDEAIIVLWSFTEEDTFYSPPVIVDNTLYAGTYGHMYAINATNGSEIWRFAGDGFTPTAVVDGVVYAPAESFIYALDAESGQELWRFGNRDPEGTPSASGRWSFELPIVTDNIVAVGSGPYIHGLHRPTGEEVWRFETSGPGWVGAYADGNIISIDGPNYHSLDPATGQERWRFRHDNSGRETWLIADNTFCCTGVDSSFNSTLFGLDLATGQERWRFSTGADIISILTEKDGLLVFVCQDVQYVYALDITTGELRWQYNLGGYPDGKLEIVGDTVYATTSSDQVIAISLATGEQEWEVNSYTPREIMPVALNGVVYVAWSYLFAIGNRMPTLVSTDVIVRAAPSDVGVEIAELSAGDEVRTTGNQENRTGKVWVEVTTQQAAGWIPLESIDQSTMLNEDEIIYLYQP